MMRRLTSGPKPAARVSAMTSSALCVPSSPTRKPVPHAVEPGQVRRHLRRQDQVVGGQREVEVRAVHLGDLGAQLGELVDRGVERRQHALLVAVAAQLPDHADPDTAQVARRARLRRGDDVGHLGVDRRRVPRVVTGDHLVQQRGVEHRARARPALVQRRRAGDQAVARHRAVGGFDADRRGQRGGLPDRPAGIRPDRQRRLERGQRRGAAAAGTAGHPVDVPRVARRPERRVLGGRAHRELVHVRLAQDRDARGAQPRGRPSRRTATSSPRGSSTRRWSACPWW